MHRNWKQSLALAIVAVCSLAIVADVQAFHHRRRGCGSSGGSYGGYNGYSYGGYDSGAGYAGGWNNGFAPGAFGGTSVYGPGAGPQAAAGVNGNAAVDRNARTNANLRGGARIDGTPMPSAADRGPNVRGNVDSSTEGAPNSARTESGALSPAPNNRGEDAVPPPSTAPLGP